MTSTPKPNKTEAMVAVLAEFIRTHTREGSGPEGELMPRQVAEFILSDLLEPHDCCDANTWVFKDHGLYEAIIDATPETETPIPRFATRTHPLPKTRICPLCGGSGTQDRDKRNCTQCKGAGRIATGW